MSPRDLITDSLGYVQTMRDRDREGRIELEVIDMLASEERVRGDRIVEVSIFEIDQYLVDEALHSGKNVAP